MNGEMRKRNLADNDSQSQILGWYLGDSAQIWDDLYRHRVDESSSRREELREGFDEHPFGPWRRVGNAPEKHAPSQPLHSGFHSPASKVHREANSREFSCFIQHEGVVTLLLLPDYSIQQFIELWGGCGSCRGRGWVWPRGEFEVRPGTQADFIRAASLQHFPDAQLHCTDSKPYVHHPTMMSLCPSKFSSRIISARPEPSSPVNKL